LIFDLFHTFVSEETQLLKEIFRFTWNLLVIAAD